MALPPRRLNSRILFRNLSMPSKRSCLDFPILFRNLSIQSQRSIVQDALREAVLQPQSEPELDPEPELVPAPKSEPILETAPELEGTNKCMACLCKILNKLQIQVPCGHYYCQKCLCKLALTSTDTETHYPPKCCGQPIPYEVLVDHLSPDDLLKFNAKRDEFAVQFARRVYCPNRTCSAFLGSSQPMSVDPDSNSDDSSGSSGSSESSQVEPLTWTCSRCDTNVCLGCREAAHPGASCNINTEVRTAAREQGWQKCPNSECRRTIERSTGCYHMSCPCGTQFCYLCASTPWKSCECPPDEGNENDPDINPDVFFEIISRVLRGMGNNIGDHEIAIGIGENGLVAVTLIHRGRQPCTCGHHHSR